jgi:hypothetical protein
VQLSEDRANEHSEYFQEYFAFSRGVLASSVFFSFGCSGGRSGEKLSGNCTHIGPPGQFPRYTMGAESTMVLLFETSARELRLNNPRLAKASEGLAENTSPKSRTIVQGAILRGQSMKLEPVAVALGSDGRTEYRK